MGRKKNKILTEVKSDDIVSDSKQSDPTRIKRSKNVKSTYIGMSKFGILNFKTTSETRNGYHYQTIEFKDLQPFWDIIEEGKEIVGADIKGQLEKQDINVYCSDESFTWWAWYHKAYKNDYAYDFFKIHLKEDLIIDIINKYFIKKLNLTLPFYVKIKDINRTQSILINQPNVQDSIKKKKKVIHHTKKQEY